MPVSLSPRVPNRVRVFPPQESRSTGCSGHPLSSILRKGLPGQKRSRFAVREDERTRERPLRGRGDASNAFRRACQLPVKRFQIRGDRKIKLALNLLFQYDPEPSLRSDNREGRTGQFLGFVEFKNLSECKLQTPTPRVENYTVYLRQT